MSEIVSYLNEVQIYDYESLSDYIWKSEIEVIHSLVMYLRQMIDTEYKIANYTPFTYVPNNDISGTGGCYEITCRIKRATQFAIFTALYADRVYIHLEFITSVHYETIDFEEFDYDEELDYAYRERVESDLAMILTYSELIKKNIVCITPTEFMMCPDCFRKKALGNKNINIEKLKSDFCKKAKVLLVDYKDGYYELAMENIDEFFPTHTYRWFLSEEEDIKVLSHEKLGRYIKNKDYANNMINDFVENEIASALQTSIYCNEQNPKLVTNKLSDTYILGFQENSSLKQIEEYNKVLPSYSMPYIDNLDMLNIINLREQENESFNKYRCAISRAITEQQKNQTNLDMNKIYDEIVFPEFNNLNMKIHQLKNGRFRNVFGNILILGSSLVAGKYGSAMQSGVLNTLSTIGGTLGATRVDSTIENRKQMKNSLLDNDYYFLWSLDKIKS